MNFSGTALSANSIIWQWNDKSDDETGFQIQDPAHNIKGSVGANVTVWTETGLSKNTSYTRHCVATNELDKSYDSNQDIVVTPTNAIPIISLIEPDGKDDTAVSNYIIKWVDSDPDDNASISLYYDTDKTGYNGILIVSGLLEDDPANQYIWNCSEIIKGTYYIYAIIDDGINSPVYAYSPGAVTLVIQASKYDEPKVEVIDDFKKPGEEKEFDIGVNLNKAGKVTIEVYDIQGELVHTICRDEQFDKGYHNIRWEVKKALGSGVYWVVMKGEDWTKTKRVAIVK